MVTSIAFLLAFCAVSVRYIPSTLSPLHPSLRRSGVVYPPPVYPPPAYPPPAYPPPAYDVVGPRGGPVDGYGAAPARPHVPEIYPPPAYTYPTPPAPAYSPYYPYMHYNPYLAMYYWFGLGLKEKEKCSGGDGCCTPDSPCGFNEGDCDVNADCKPGLACGVDNCWGDNFDATDDCCYVLPAAQRPTPTPIPPPGVFPVRCTGGDDCCTPTSPCGPGEGDCDADADCRGNLRCGNDNCRGTGFDSTDDCCMV